MGVLWFFVDAVELSNVRGWLCLLWRSWQALFVVAFYDCVYSTGVEATEDILRDFSQALDKIKHIAV
jgi:hypothetical protein